MLLICRPTGPAASFGYEILVMCDWASPPMLYSNENRQIKDYGRVAVIVRVLEWNNGSEKIFYTPSLASTGSFCIRANVNIRLSNVFY